MDIGEISARPQTGKNVSIYMQGEKKKKKKKHAKIFMFICAT